MILKTYLQMRPFLSKNETFSEPSIGKLRVYYTNADSLLNKIGELEVLIGIVSLLL